MILYEVKFRFVLSWNINFFGVTYIPVSQRLENDGARLFDTVVVVVVVVVALKN